MSILHPKYRPDIDGLRGFAVISVIFFHAFPAYFPSGFIGVDIFFVISGYLISSIIFSSLDNGAFSFKEFYLRRIKRIFPSLVIALFACLSLGWFVLFPNELKQLGKHLAGGAGFLLNFLLIKEAGYFDTIADTKPLLHLWSLGIEEQFYIVWPLLVSIFWIRRKNIFIKLIILMLFSFIFNIYKSENDIVLTFYSPFTRIWELLCGSILAWFHISKNKKSNIKRVSIFHKYLNVFNYNFLKNILSVFGFVLIMIGLIFISKDVPFPGFWALFPVFGSVIIIATGPNAWINSILFSRKFLIWIGLISYPLYLWHWILLSFSRIIESRDPNIIIIIIILLLSFLLAWASYYFIEKPIRFSNRFKFTPIVLIIAMVFIGISGFTIYMNKGFEMRFDKQKPLIDIISRPRKPVSGVGCGKIISEFNEFNFAGGCMLSLEKEPEIMFIGDSHMGQYHSAVWKYFSHKPILLVIEHGCLPFSSNHFMRGDCKNKFNAIVKFIKRNKSIKKVYLTGYWSFLMTGGSGREGLRWRNSLPVINEVVKPFQKYGEQLISTIIESGKKLVFLKDIPDLDFDIYSCLNIRPFHLSPNTKAMNNCSLNYEKYLERNKEYDIALNDILMKFPDAKVYDPRPLFCKNGKCAATDGYLPYYENGDHLNDYGGDIVISDLVKK